MKKPKIVYHGTNKENADKILKTGFKAETYFATNLADALEFGGEYIFSVILLLEENDTNWQPRCKTTLSKNRITRLIKVNPKMIYENDKVRQQYFGKGKKVPCSNCGEDIGNVRLSIFGKPIIARCPKCGKIFN